MTMITDFAPTSYRAARPSRSLWRTIVTAVNVMQERARLARMEEHELADIGVDRVQAAREAGRPVWDLPRGR